MPNWCDNTINIRGPVDLISKLWEDAQVASQGDFGLLQAMVPMPAELNDTKGLGDGPNWYDWRVDNWGTKWDIDADDLELVDNENGTAVITGCFRSAWAPPVRAYENFFDMMTDCSIDASYHEPGMDFAGYWSDGNEEHLDGLRDEYELPEAERSPLFNRLDEQYDLCEAFAMWDEE